MLVRGAQHLVRPFCAQRSAAFGWHGIPSSSICKLAAHCRSPCLFAVVEAGVTLPEPYSRLMLERCADALCPIWACMRHGCGAYEASQPHGTCQDSLRRLLCAGLPSSLAS
jgi:hypothetical protein